jgi:hypothetical protein
LVLEKGKDFNLKTDYKQNISFFKILEIPNVFEVYDIRKEEFYSKN